MNSSLWKNRHLLLQLTKRDILTRYKGSWLGIFWSLLSPIAMLLVYTFVFGVVFKARWAGVSEQPKNFSLILFSGLICFNIFSESVSRASTAISANPNFVKKIVFPLEALPVVLVLSALWNAAICWGVLIASQVIMGDGVPLTSFLFPLILLPFILTCCGLCWFLSSLGVFLRDLNQIVPIFISTLMFLSPIFYPIEALPEAIRPMIILNPTSLIVENARRVLIFGQMPEIFAFSISLLSGLAIFFGGYIWFNKTRKGFADVI